MGACVGGWVRASMRGKGVLHVLLHTPTLRTITAHTRICGHLLKNHEIKNIYLFGASYNNSLLLHKIANRLNIKGVLDNCEDKQGDYFYGFDTLILSPSILKKEDAIVILKNGVYNKEIKKQLSELNKKTIVLN